MRRPLATMIAGFVLTGAVSSGCGTSPSTPDRYPDPPHFTSARPNVPEPPPPSADDPVTAAAWLAPPTAVPGGAAELRVKVRVADGYHLYTAAAANHPFTAASIEVKPADPIRPNGRCAVQGADERGRLRGA